MHCSFLPRQHLLSQSAFSRAQWSNGGKSKCERKLEQGRKRKQRRNPVFQERDVEVANYIEISPFLRRAEQSHTSLIPLWTLMLLWYLSHTSLTTLSWLSHTYLTYLSQPSLIPLWYPSSHLWLPPQKSVLNEHHSCFLLSWFSAKFCFLGEPWFLLSPNCSWCRIGCFYFRHTWSDHNYQQSRLSNLPFFLIPFSLRTRYLILYFHPALPLTLSVCGLIYSR